MKNLTLLVLFIIFYSLSVNAQLYQQQFTNAMTTVTNAVVTDANYVGTSPVSTSQLTYLASSNSSSSIGVSGGAMQIATGSTSGRWVAVRNDNFTGPPLAVKVTFDATIDVGSSGTGSPAKWNFYVGSGFTNSISTEANANVHSGFGIKYYNSNYYFVKTLAGGGGETTTDRITDATNLTFTFVANNSGSTITYTAPDLTTESVANDTWDLWVGTTKRLDDQAATTPGQSLSQIKFGDLASNNGRANWTLDNFSVNSLSVVLPITLEYFKGQKATNNNKFSWRLNCLSSNKITMDIQRSADAKKFSTIQTIEADQARCAMPFDYTETNPLNITNYYRLKITDVDGKVSYSNIVALINGQKTFEFVNMYPTVVKNETLLNITSAKATTVNGTISDVNGRVIKKLINTVPEGSSLIKIDCTALSVGMYTYTGYSQGVSSTMRFVKL